MSNVANESGAKSSAWWQAEGLLKDQFYDLIEFIRQFDPRLTEYIVEYVAGEILARDILSEEERMLCALSALTISGEHAVLAHHIRVALQLQIATDKICESIIHCIPFYGLPKVLGGLQVLKQELVAAGEWQKFYNQQQEHNTAIPVTTQFLRKQGLNKGALLYEDYPATEAAVSSYDEIMPKLITEGIFGRFYGRDEISIRQRQLCAVTILTVGQRLPQLKSHIIGARRVGCDWREIKEAIILMHLYVGWPATLNALQVWKEVKDNSKQGS